ncbi:MAG: FAD binding domain-containing protein [Actinomycetota bacterium]
MAAETLVPSSAAEAVQLFGDGKDITVFAGGTILMPEIAAGRLKPARTLLLHRSGLDELRSDGGVVRIGTTVAVAALVDGEDELLARFSQEIGDREVRAAATVGGNLCASAGLGAQRGDLGAPLIALGARVRSDGKGGERTEPVEDFLAGDQSGRLVLEIEYDKPAGAWSAQTLRRRHAHSYSVANVAICANGDGLRVGVSGIGPAAVRARAVEQSRNADDVLKDADPVDDAVASAAYRRKMLVLLTRRALDDLEKA